MSGTVPPPATAEDGNEQSDGLEAKNQATVGPQRQRNHKLFLLTIACFFFSRKLSLCTQSEMVVVFKTREDVSYLLCSRCPKKI